MMVHWVMILFVAGLPGILCEYDPDDANLDTIPGPAVAKSVNKSDVLFVLDASSSIGIEQFDAMRGFIKELVETEFKKIGRNSKQVGLVEFADDVVAFIPLNKYTDGKKFIDAVNDLKYVRGGSNLGKALDFVHKTALTPANGYRPTVPRAIIMLTDGWVSDVKLAKKEIDGLKRTDGIHPLMVGMGEHVEDAGIRDLVGAKDDVKLQKWKGLKDKLPEMREKLQSDIEHIDRCSLNTKANVVFMVDSSSSIGPRNFEKVKTFIINTIRAFKAIGKKGIQVALLQYSSYRKTKVIFQLDEYNNHKDIERAIRNMKWTKGRSRTGYAMRMASRWILPKARKGVHNNFIVITDGRSNDRADVGAKELHALGCTVLVVGTGKAVKDRDLRIIASQPKELHIFHPEDYEELQYFLRYVVTEVCHNVDQLSKQQAEEKAASSEKEPPAL